MTTAVQTAIEALAAAREEIASLPIEDAKTALLRLHEAMWEIDEDNRKRD